MTQEQIDKIFAEYEAHHGVIPRPLEVPDAVIARVLEEHMEDGLPEDYNWWAYLPEGAVA